MKKKKQHPTPAEYDKELGLNPAPYKPLNLEAQPLIEALKRVFLTEKKGKQQRR